MGNLKQFAETIGSKVRGNSFLAKLTARGKNVHRESSTVIAISESGFAIVEVALKGQIPQVLCCQFVSNTNASIRAELIAELIERRGINTQSVKMVLCDSRYKFLLAEAPQAPIESLRAIMPVKIKDSLPWRLSEITADVLMLPSDAFRGRKRSVYVAVANNPYLEEQLEMLKSIRVEPVGVTTVEIALKAYWRLLETPAAVTVGILCMTESGGVIIMVCDGAIYLARRMAIALDTLGAEGVNKQDVFDQVILEIQRSVDFYESQLGKGPVSKIVLLQPPVDLGIGFDYIEQNISVDIELFRPLEQLEYTHDLTQVEESNCMGALGAALEGLNRA